MEEAALEIRLAGMENGDADIAPIISHENDTREGGETALVFYPRTKALGASMVKESCGMGGTLQAIGGVIESCISTEILKSKFVLALLSLPILIYITENV